MKTIIKKMGIIVAILLSFISASAYDFEVDNVYYDVVSLEEMTCEIVGAHPNVEELELHGVVNFKGREFTAKIKEEAFKEYEIKSLWIGDGIEEIPDRAFESCEKLKTVELESVKIIGVCSFNKCKVLSEIDLGKTEIIRYGAFDDCAFKTITIPGTVVEAWDLPLEDVDEVNFLWGEENLQLYNTYISAKVYLNRNIYGLTENTVVKEIALGNEVTVFPSFLGRCLSKIDLSQTNIKTIEEAAFGSKRVGPPYYSFTSELEEIKLPECLDSIKSNAFSTSQLQEIILPSSLKYLGSSAFRESKKLETAYIPGSIKVVPEDCFASCGELSDITLEEGIEVIGKKAFYNTSNLKSIQLPETLTTIGEAAFNGADKLSSLYIPGNVSLIEANAFKGCKDLKKLELGVSNIALQTKQAFYSSTDTGLKNYTYPSEEKAYQNIYTENMSLLSPLMVDNLTHLTVNRPVESEYSQDYYPYEDDCMCDHIESYCAQHYIFNLSLIFPNSTLTYLNIGENCKDIFAFEGEAIEYNFKKYLSGVFEQINIKETYYVSPALYPENLGNLKEISVQMMTPPELPTDFPFSTYLSATLRVPIGAKAAYESAPYWKNFWEIVETDDFNSVGEIPIDSYDNYPIEWYNLNGIKMNDHFENLPNGVYLLRQGNKTKKIYKH